MFPLEQTAPPPCVRALKHLSTMLNSDLTQVDALFMDCLSSPVSYIPDVGNHLLQAGGKRLRPLLALASARLFDTQATGPISLATCVELIHMATLLHDDVIDDGTTRRRMSAAHRIWGAKASILVGDFLLSQAFRLMIAIEDKEAMRILCTTAQQIVSGELLQLTKSHTLGLSQDIYIQIITNKTACLFEAACDIGALLGTGDIAPRQALKTYGLSLGIAFQLMDDHLDYTGKEETLGKPLYQDLNERKATLPVLHAYAAGSTADKTFWEDLFHDPNVPLGTEQITYALSLLAEQKSLQHTRALAESYIASAVKALTTAIPPSPLRSALEAVAAFAIERPS